MMTLTTSTVALDALAMDDAQLDIAIQKAREATHATTILVALEEEQHRRQAQREADAQERTELLARLRQQVTDYRAEFLAQLRELEATSPAEAGALVEAAITSAKQWFALGSSLAGTRGERFAARWDGSDQIALHSPRAWAAYWARIGARPVPLTREQQPWIAALERLKMLIGPRVTAIGNGG